MEALKSEHRANIEVLRKSLQQELHDVKAGYEEQQMMMNHHLLGPTLLVVRADARWGGSLVAGPVCIQQLLAPVRQCTLSRVLEQQKLSRRHETERNLVANSQKAQLGLVLEALKKAHKARIEKMKEEHASVIEQLAIERVQLKQRMAEETSAIQEMKSEPEAHYTEIVHTAWVECAIRVKWLHDELVMVCQRHEKDPLMEEKVVAATTSLSTAEKPVMAVLLDSLDVVRV
ncbi:hypothetical protein HPB51_011818 [Rhipicephalus microplus]|uniref:Uncharacterized protein n=1 Tax=Rhipicephalus microplus TaxID=6941 RepID=A0A9J6DG33_RHIMP|nr:hypothetical protein HPB51_011818 [Rhipicephalus microplus]